MNLRLLYPSSVSAVDGLLKISIQGRSAIELSLEGEFATDLNHALESVEIFARFVSELNNRASYHAARRISHGG